LKAVAAGASDRATGCTPERWTFRISARRRRDNSTISARHLGSSASAYRVAVMALPAAILPIYATCCPVPHPRRAALFRCPSRREHWIRRIVDRPGNVLPHDWRRSPNVVVWPGPRVTGHAVDRPADWSTTRHPYIQSPDTPMRSPTATHLEPGPAPRRRAALLSASTWDTLDPVLCNAPRLRDHVLTGFVRATPCDSSGVLPPQLLFASRVMSGPPAASFCPSGTSCSFIGVTTARRRRPLQGDRRRTQAPSGRATRVGDLRWSHQPSPNVLAYLAAACLTVGAASAALR